MVVQMDDLIRRIQERKSELGIDTDAVLARKANLAQSDISKLLNQKVKSPSAEVIQKIATALDTSVEWLLTGKELSTPPGNLKPLPKVYPEGQNGVAKVAETPALFFAEDILDKRLPHLLALLEYAYTQANDSPLRRDEIEAFPTRKLNAIKPARDGRKRAKKQ